jgi:cytochrome c553
MPPSFRSTVRASLHALVLASAMTSVWAGAATPPAPAAAAQCAACHGADGNNGDNSTGSGAPSLAGQLPAYIKLQLANFKSGERPHAAMQAIAAGLTAQQIDSLSAWYGAAPPAIAVAEDWMPKPDPAELARGKQVFEHGAGGAPACATCHGARGQGQAAPLLYPRIASQEPAYTAEQLKVYRNAPSFKNPLAMVMKSVAVKLSEADAQAVSLYLSTIK